jgi:hypothetical protein
MAPAQLHVLCYLVQVVAAAREQVLASAGQRPHPPRVAIHAHLHAEEM